MACQALCANNDDNIILSNYSVSSGTSVNVGCRDFARRLTVGTPKLKCLGGAWKTLDTSTSAVTTFKCEFNGDLNTYEKLIIGLSSAGGGALVFGIILIICLYCCYKDEEKDENDFDSYPPSAINEKVGYAQYGNGGSGGGISGYRPSGKYEKQINPDPRLETRTDTSKRDPILWSAYNSNQPREPERIDQPNGYQFYSGKNSSTQYDNRAFERNEPYRGSGYRDPSYNGTNYVQGKREDYRWNGHLPRAQMPRDDRYNRQY